MNVTVCCRNFRRLTCGPSVRFLKNIVWDLHSDQSGFLGTQLERMFRNAKKALRATLTASARQDADILPKTAASIFGPMTNDKVRKPTPKTMHNMNT